MFRYLGGFGFFTAALISMLNLADLASRSYSQDDESQRLGGSPVERPQVVFRFDFTAFPDDDGARPDEWKYCGDYRTYIAQAGGNFDKAIQLRNAFAMQKQPVEKAEKEAREALDALRKGPPPLPREDEQLADPKMIVHFFLALASAATKDELKLARAHYSDVLISDRFYCRNWYGGKGTTDFRFYVDKSYCGNSTMVFIHEEGWALGLGYQRGLCLLKTAGKLRVFFADFEKPWDGIEAPIRR